MQKKAEADVSLGKWLSAKLSCGGRLGKAKRQNPAVGLGMARGTLTKMEWGGVKWKQKGLVL